MTTAIRTESAAAATQVSAKDWTDQELLAECIAKNNRAWQELLRRYDGPLRGVVYNRLKHSIDRLPSDYKDDIMGAFYLKLIDNNMAALRSFDFNKGKALFKWLAFLVIQCACDYLETELNFPEYDQLEGAVLEVADEGGVLASGRGRLRGSLSERARKQNLEAKRASVRKARVARQRRRSEIRKSLRKQKPSK